MQNDKLNQLTRTGLSLFDSLAKAYAAYDIPILMADHVPQRGGILSEFVTHGGQAFIAGGKDGQQFFPNVPQYTLNYDTFNSRDASSIKAITNCFPKGIVRENLATFSYTPQGDRDWARGIQENVGGTIVASNEQNFRSYFEEKTNLTDILTRAGLQKHIIPSTVIRNSEPLSDVYASLLYRQLSDNEGRIVVQRCGEGNAERGGGKSTEIVSSFEEFHEIVSAERDSYLKIAKFVSGCNSNLSLCAGNTIPSETMLGAVKGELLPYESRFKGETLDFLRARGEELGLNESNIVVNVQPGTLKVVGDPHLTKSSTNGVGNQLNYNYDKDTMDEIFNIGQKLGAYMALCGKVGLCGLDLIITKDGEIFINELNDRQQGPTESAGLNNEANGLPSIHREAFLMNYADLKNPEVSSYLQELNENSKEIYEASAQIPSPFYIKVHALKNSFATTDLKPGDYVVTKDNQGNCHWDLENSLDLPQAPETDVNKDMFIARINTVSAKKDDFIPEDSQLLRINGIATSESAPFTINAEGDSVLAENWITAIDSLYATALTQNPVQTTKFETSQSACACEK